MSFEGNEGPAAEEDIYGGFNEHDNALEDPLGDGEDDAGFAEAVKTSYGNRPIKTGTTRQSQAQAIAAGGYTGLADGVRLKTGMRLKTGQRLLTAQRGMTGRLQTGMAPDESETKRPITAHKTAGFRRADEAAGADFDPTGRSRGSAPPLEAVEDSPEEFARTLEKKVHTLMEESAVLANTKKFPEAIELAKKAVTNEKQLSKLKEEQNPDSVNFDLTYAVQLHLGSLYQRASMDSEAIHTFQGIVKSKMFDKAGRLKVNLGNIYFKQKKYLQAVKMYRMSLDQIPHVTTPQATWQPGSLMFPRASAVQPGIHYVCSLTCSMFPSPLRYTQQQMRNKVLRNIGHAFVKMGSYSDAIASYEHVLNERPNCIVLRVPFGKLLTIIVKLSPTKEIGGVERKIPGKDFPTAFNLILCYYALGERERMRRGFEMLLSQELSTEVDDERYLNLANDEAVQTVLDAIKMDGLKLFEEREKEDGDKCIVTAAKLISTHIESSFAPGYDWCIDKVRQSRYGELAAELEVMKAVTYLKQKDFKKAIETLKHFDKSESKMQSAAATNMAFLYFLESQYAQADKYADLAIAADRYNPSALVNKGNCAFVNDDWQQAANFYKEALSVDSGYTEALYNLGLCHKNMDMLDAALDYFEKLHALLPNSAEIIYQVARCFQLLGDVDQSLDWLLKLVSVVPTDPGALAHLGSLFDHDNDKSQAFQYHFEAFRYFPADIRTVEWLGAYYVESQYPEKAIQYFERAALVEPNEVKWRLMVASCYRRAGNYQAALDAYRQIHILFPENIECLRFLVRITTDLGMKDSAEYTEMLKKAEKLKASKESQDERKERKTASGRSRSGKDRGSRGGSGSSSGGGGSGPPSAAQDGRRRRDRTSSTDDNLRHQADPPVPPSDLPGMQPQSAAYSDPMGALPERPKTGARRPQDDVDEWDDHDLGDDMLPE